MSHSEQITDPVEFSYGEKCEKGVPGVFEINVRVVDRALIHSYWPHDKYSGCKHASVFIS